MVDRGILGGRRDRGRADDMSRMTWAEHHQIFLKRDALMIKVAIRSPHISTHTMGKFFGLTHQAVSQILSRNGVRKMRASKAKRLLNQRRCDVCGKAIRKSRARTGSLRGSARRCRACAYVVRKTIREFFE